MIHDNAAEPANSMSPTAENGESTSGKLRQQCEMLRRSLAEAEAQRDEYRRMLYAHIRDNMADADKAELERRAVDVIENGGVPFRDVLNELIQSQGR